MKTKLYLSILVSALLISGAFAWSTNAVSASDDSKDPIGTPEYNPRDEFSLTQGGTNGLWNYGVSTSDADNTFTLFAPTDIITQSSGCNGGSFEKWLKEPAGDQLPQIARHNPAATCSNIPTNSVFMHPGRNDQRVVLRFNAPASGTFQIAGSFQKQNLSATSDLKIIKNGGLPGETVLYTGVIGAVYQQAFNFSASIAAGDKIDFSVGDSDNGQNSDGSTLAVTIGQPIAACLTAPANLQVNVPAENSPTDVQSINTNATLVGDATYSNAGKVGRAFEFDGSGDYVRIEDNAAQRPATAVTAEGWFKFDSVSGIVSLISKPIRNSAFNSHTLYLENGQLRGLIGNASQYTRALSSFVPQTGVWHHLAFTYELSGGVSTLKLYANGTEVTSAVDGTANLPIFYDANPYPLLIGADFENNAPTFFLDGQADEVSVYGRALSQTEIFNLTKQGTFGKCPPANCIQAPNNLVSWFAGEQNALDSRSNNHGTVSNATFATGKVGQAFNLNGSNNFVEFADSPSLNSTTGTWEFWMQTTQSSSSPVGVLGKHDSVFSYNGMLFHMNSNGTISVVIKPNTSAVPTITSPNPVNDGNFHHIAATFQSGGQLNLYVDGVLIGTAVPPNFTFSSQPLRVGRLVDTFWAEYNGLIDELTTYNRVLSSSEIQSIVNAGQSGKCKPSLLNPAANQIAWFAGDGDIRDLLGLNPNGILQGDTNFRVGRVGQSFNFDGNGDHVEVPDDADHRPSNITVEGWFKANSLAGSPHFVSKPLIGNASNSYVIWYQGGELRGGHGNSSGGFDTLLTGFSPNIGEWYHFAYAIDDASDTHRFFVNGVQVATAGTSLPIFYDTVTPHPLLIGGELDNNTLGSFLNGQADEVSIFSRVLSESEIAAIYNAGTAGKSKSKPTTAGSNVQTQLSDATVTFASVSSAGTTTQNSIDLGLLPALPSPASFTGLAYNISTTATHQNGTADDVRVCFNIPSLSGIPIATLRVLQLVGGSWIDQTGTGNTQANFCTDNASSLTQFVIVQYNPAQLLNASGRVTDSNGNGLHNVLIQLSDETTVYGNLETDVNGYYTWTNIVPGNSYTFTPLSGAYTFTPASRFYTNILSNISGIDFTATAPCTYTFSPESSELFTSAGGSGSFTVTTQSGCQWSATTNANATPWVTFNGSSSGTGIGTVSYAVAANTSIFRVGEILVNGTSAHTIGQQTGSGTCPTVTPIAYGTVISGALAASDCDLSGRYTDQYSFSGTAGDRVMIRLSSNDFAESIILHNTANTTIYTFTTGGAANDARIPNSFGFYTLPATGTYIVSASNWGNGGSPTGNYTLTLHSDRTVPGVTPPSGLIGWYAGEGDTRNQQGNSPGTFNGTATYLTDYAGQSFSMNGTNRYVEVPAASEAFNVSSLSVEAWVNTTTTNGDPNTGTPKYRTIASKFNGMGGASWSLDMEQGGAIVFAVYDGTTANYRAVRTAGAAAFLTANEWKHVAATFDQTTQAINLYVNGSDAGQLVAGSATSLSGIGQSAVPLRIGANQNGTVQGFWQGRLDELSIYNRALNTAEVTSIVDAGRIGKIKQAALVNQTTANLGSSTVNFAVATTGTVTETPIDGSALPAPLPLGSGLQLAFNISTNAPFTGNATVCFAVPSVTPAVFAGLKVYHFEGGAWVDRTAPNNIYPSLCALTPSFSPFAIAGPLAPSASEVSVRGRVQTANGLGISNANLTLTQPDGSVRTARSSSFGYYSFNDIQAGQTAVIAIRSKRFIFLQPTRVISIADELADVDFIAEP